MEKEKSRVVRVRASGSPDIPLESSPEALKRMIETGLLLLTGTGDPAAAWARYFSRRDTIGIKVNCLGGRNMCTRPALAAGAAASLASLGVAPHQVIVWDRIGRELKRCGFPLNNRSNGSFRCLGTDEIGAGYEHELTVQGSVGSRFSTLITRHCTAMINMPVLKDHGLCGVTAALKNTFGALHNPNKYHEDRCNPFVADANAVPFVRKKNRLVICDALTVQYKGGPGYHQQWAEPLRSILISEDPVALDTVGAAILEEIRRQKGLPPLEADGGLPAYLETAADPEHRLGRCRAGQIDLVEKEISL
jgi:uncharacterized protein (DUF362 family)